MMRRTYILLVMLAGLFVPASDLGAVQVNLSQMQAMLVTCMKLIQTEDFYGAALMYHYPPHYTQDELDKDIAAVAESLSILSEEFGQFGPVKSLEEQTLYVNIHVSGGTHTYWDQQRQAFKVELTTEFENFGPGFLVFQVVEIVGTLEIKAIAYGLPVSGESVARIKKVGDRMLHLVQQPLDKRTFPGAAMLTEEN